MRVFRYVDAVARAGSVRRAAEQMHVTPSAILRRIQDVEEDLGEKLFERTSDGMILTQAGNIFIDWLRRQAAGLELVQSQIDEIGGLRRGVVRLACSQAAAARLLPEEIARFQRDHGAVSFEIDVCGFDVAVKKLAGYEAELALVFGAAEHAGLTTLCAADQLLVAIMARDHPLARHASVSLCDCVAYPLALLDRRFSGRRLIDAALGERAAKPVLVEANSMEMLMAYVGASSAITFQAQIGADVAAAHGLAVRRVDDAESTHAPLVLLQLRGRELPLAASRFAGRMADALKKAVLF
jgi:DNA-binding transcriptional LysR family regulator